MEFNWNWHISPLPDKKILDWSKLEQIADNISKCIKNGKLVPHWVREKEKLLVTSNFSCFYNVFLSYISLVRHNTVLCGNGLIVLLYCKQEQQTARRTDTVTPLFYSPPLSLGM